MAKSDLQRVFAILAILGAIVAAAAESAGVQPTPTTACVRVRSTLQDYDGIRPWQKKAPGTRAGIGALIGPNRVLVTAGLVANATFIELEHIRGGERSPATVEYVDYDGNLATLRADREGFFANATPLALVDHALPGDVVDVWQFDDDGTPTISQGPIRNVELGGYPFGDALLLYAAEIPIPQLDGSFTFPITRAGQLVGMLISYRAATRILQILPAPVIAHFLRDLGSDGLGGVPRAGFGYTRLEDPQLRDYVALPAGETGVYITGVQPASPAADAGLKAGDVLLAIDDFDVNDRGEYADPVYGNLSVANLTKTRSCAGDTLQFVIFRDGRRQTVPVHLSAMPAWMQPVPPYQVDRPPVYLITGGFIFQELTQEYLKEWGSEWPQKAPQRLVFLSRKQWDLLKPGDRVVFIAGVLPAEPNTGYNSLTHEIVSKVNGRDIHDLLSVAEALEHPILGPDGKTRFLHLEFAYTHEEVYLLADLLEPLDKFIQQRYRLPALRRLDTR